MTGDGIEMGFQKNLGWFTEILTFLCLSGFQETPWRAIPPAGDPANPRPLREHYMFTAPKGVNVAVYAAVTGVQGISKSNITTNAGVMVIALDTLNFSNSRREDEDDCEFPRWRC